MITIDNINFPVFAISTENYISTIPNKNRLGVCTFKTYKNGWHENLKIYDSNGNIFLIEEAKKRRIHLSIDLLLMNPFIDVFLQISDKTSSYSFESLRKIVFENVEKYPEYWENINYFEKIKQDIMRCKNFKELFIAFHK